MSESHGLAAVGASTGVVQQFSVARLMLTDFRSYRQLRLETDSRPVVLTGANGAGKTNLLEAVSFLVPGRGLRNARLGEVARREAGDPEEDSGRAWAVAAHVSGPRGPADLGTGRDAASVAGGRERRLVRIDGETARGQADLAEYFAAVWLTPRMDRLFAEGPSARRRFLDRLVFGFDAAHAGRVAAYEHALRERARLLREGQTGRRVDGAWLAALEDTMATRGVAVTAARIDMAARLAAFCAESPGPFPAAAIGLIGVVEDWLAEGPALAAEDRFRARLAEDRRADADSGATQVGPHRSDLVVRDIATGVPAEQGSTGQQKALLIAVILASARLQAAERGSVPLLLLDEVAAHLDTRRREALFEELLGLGAQVWMTGTDAEVFRPLAGAAQFFHVADATVAPAP